MSSESGIPVLKATTLTMTVPLRGSADVAKSFNLLPVVYPKLQNGNIIVINSGKRDKVPFFGVEGIIICTRYGGQTRGVRVGGEQMGNINSIDLQAGGKHISVKLSQNTLQLTGALSEEMGQTAFQYIVWHLNNCQKNLNHIKTLSDEVVLVTRNWVSDLTKYTSTNIDISNSGNVSSIDYVTEVTPERFEEAMKTKPEKADADVAKFLLMYTSDFCYGPDKFHSLYLNKIDYILGFVLVAHCEVARMKESMPSLTNGNEILSLGQCRISNGVYNYKWGSELICSHLAVFLYNSDLAVEFNNSAARCVKVCIKIDKPETEKKPMEKPEKMSFHRFTINPTGSIRQYSPTSYSDAVKMYHQMLTYIGMYFIAERSGSEMTTKIVERTNAEYQHIDFSINDDADDSTCGSSEGETELSSQVSAITITPQTNTIPQINIGVMPSCSSVSSITAPLPLNIITL